MQYSKNAMRITIAKYRFLFHSFALVLPAVLIVSLAASAQKNEAVKETPGKITSKKATRVFYGQASYYANKFNGIS